MTACCPPISDEFQKRLCECDGIPRSEKEGAGWFGFDDIKHLCALELRDTNGTYDQEIEASWAEALRNLPREPFVMNQARDLRIPLEWKKSEYRVPNLQDIINIKVRWGNLWIFLTHMPVNSTDFFATERAQPVGFPIWYDYFGDIIKLFPAPAGVDEMVITAQVAGWMLERPCDIRLDRRYLTFVKDWTMMLLYQNYLRDTDGLQLKIAALSNERQVLHNAQITQSATGRILAGW